MCTYIDKGRPNSESYPGPGPFSEPQSRNIRDFADRFRPDIYVNTHSGIRELYIGWDHRGEYIPEPERAIGMLEAMNLHCDCPLGPAGKIGGYVVFGGSMDYLYDVLGCPYSITIEVFGGKGSDCFTYFNPSSKEDYLETTNSFAHALVEA
eukprot:g65832.t1